MGTLIPWEQLAPPIALWADSEETVRAVRDRLQALGGHEQYNIPLLVRLADGRVAPTAAPKLRQLAQEKGATILERRVTDLLVALCPGPWSIESPGPKFVEASNEASRRQLPVVVTEGGQPVGLMLPPSHLALSVIRTKEEFDLFDDPLPRERLEQTEFVVATPQNTVAKVALDLKAKREPENAYIVVDRGAGSFGLLPAKRLRDKVAGEGAGVWGEPLDAFESYLDLSTATRDNRAVGVKQAEALTARNALILLEDGKPVGLLPKTTILLGLDSSETVSHSSPKGITGDLFSASAEILSLYPSEAKAEIKPRFVNLWFADSTKQRLDKTKALVEGKTYHLALQIGKRLAESIIDWEQTPGGARAIVEPQEKTAYLYVSVFSEDFYVPEPTQALLLPQAEETGILHFEIEPLRPSLRREDKAKLEVCVYYRAYLVQTFEVLVEVGADETARSAKPQTASLVHCRTASFPAMEQLAPRDLSLTITHAGPDRYRFTFLADPDPDDPGAAAKAIELRCHVDLTRDELTHLITKARRQLYNVVRSYDLIQEGTGKIAQKAVRALAQVGHQLYLRLFKSPDAATLARWMEESLPAGSIIQIVSRAKDFVFPWSLIYTAAPWDEDTPLDVEQFWGWRYQLAVATDDLVDTYRAAGEEIQMEEELQAFFGLYERLAGADEQYAYFDRLGIKAIESRNETVAAFKQTAPQLVYFFCHGYTEKMANDIQPDDDLLRGFIQMTADKQQSGDQAIREHIDDLFEVSDSWMRLSWSKLPLTMLREELKDTTLSAHPLVFLNMCQSAQVLPSLSDGLIPFFIEKGARAIIGTECSMDMRFGDRFARSFLDRFLDGEPAAKTLWQLRQEGLRQNDPLALAYTLFGDAGVRLRKPAVSDENQAKLEQGGPMLDQTQVRDAVDRMWQADDDSLYGSLAVRAEAAEKGMALGQLDQPDVRDRELPKLEDEGGPLDMEKAREIGKRWWAKFEPKIYDLLCNKKNPEHDKFVDALGGSAKELAVLLAPSLVASLAGALPAVVVVVATIAAKKIADAGLEAMCEVWAEAREDEAEG